MPSSCPWATLNMHGVALDIILIFDYFICIISSFCKTILCILCPQVPSTPSAPSSRPWATWPASTAVSASTDPVAVSLDTKESFVRRRRMSVRVRRVRMEAAAGMSSICTPACACQVSVNHETFRTHLRTILVFCSYLRIAD